MRAILIDPFTRDITEVEYTGDIGCIYEHIQANCFDAARFDNKGDAVYVDDEGLLKEPTHFFQIAGYPQPLAGRGLVLGVDREGESVSPTVSLDWVRANTTFMVKAGPFLFIRV